MSNKSKHIPSEEPEPQTMSIPEAGFRYFGLSRNGSYDAAARGEIPFMSVGKLKRVSIAKMDAIMRDGVNAAPAPAPIETPVKAVKSFPRSTAVKRRESA